LMDYLVAAAASYFGYYVDERFVITTIVFAAVFVVFYIGVLWVTQDEED